MHCPGPNAYPSPHRSIPPSAWYNPTGFTAPLPGLSALPNCTIPLRRLLAQPAPRTSSSPAICIGLACKPKLHTDPGPAPHSLPSHNHSFVTLAGIPATIVDGTSSTEVLAQSSRARASQTPSPGPINLFRCVAGVGCRSFFGNIYIYTYIYIRWTAGILSIFRTLLLIVFSNLTCRPGCHHLPNLTCRPRCLHLLQVVVIASDSPETVAAGDVVITANSGATAVSPSAWRYLKPGIIDTVDPAFGQVGTGVTLTGSNLLGGGTVAKNVRCPCPR